MIQIIASPYYLGHRNRGMGAGPTALLDAGAAQIVAKDQTVNVHTVQHDNDGHHEVGASIAVNRSIAESVRRAKDGGQFPIVLGGNCNVCLGVIAGLNPSNVGIVWFDAHGDFHDASTTASGFFDGFPLSMATGRSWQTLTATIPDFQPVDEAVVVLAGTRDLDPGEDKLVEQSRLQTHDLKAFETEGIDGFSSCLDRLSARVNYVYLHVDLDVIDGTRFPVNSYAPPGGLDPNTLTACFEEVGRRFNVLAGSLNCYDPTGDPAGITCAVALEVLTSMGALSNGRR